MAGTPTEIHLDHWLNLWLALPRPPCLFTGNRRSRRPHSRWTFAMEKVPLGEPTEWCYRMAITRKHHKSPRRTVDLSLLNKFCKRETNAFEAPFHLARRVSRNSWKTVTDAWNGYDSIPLRVSVLHFTKFILPLGKWRYTRVPQSFFSSEEG